MTISQVRYTMSNYRFLIQSRPIRLNSLCPMITAQEQERGILQPAPPCSYMGSLLVMGDRGQICLLIQDIGQLMSLTMRAQFNFTAMGSSLQVSLSDIERLTICLVSSP